jgi:hypothetical protein
LFAIKIDRYISPGGEEHMITFRDQIEATRSGVLLSRLLWLDETSTQLLSRSNNPLSNEDAEALLSVTSEMLGLLDDLPSTAETLRGIFLENRGAFNEFLKALTSKENPVLERIIIRFEKAGGFESCVVNSAETLSKRWQELHEDLEKRQEELTARGIVEFDFPHWAICAMRIGIAGCCAVGAGLGAGAGAAVLGPLAAAFVAGSTAYTAFISNSSAAIVAGCL